jgi:hypothetical protein
VRAGALSVKGSSARRVARASVGAASTRMMSSTVRWRGSENSARAETVCWECENQVSAHVGLVGGHEFEHLVSSGSCSRCSPCGDSQRMTARIAFGGWVPCREIWQNRRQSSCPSFPASLHWLPATGTGPLLVGFNGVGARPKTQSPSTCVSITCSRVQSRSWIGMALPTVTRSGNS